MNQKKYTGYVREHNPLPGVIHTWRPMPIAPWSAGNIIEPTAFGGATPKAVMFLLSAN